MKEREKEVILLPNNNGIHIYKIFNIITFEYLLNGELIKLKINLNDKYICRIISKIAIKSKNYNKYLESELLNILNNDIIFDDFEDLTLLDLMKFELEKENNLVI